ncbi:thiosulfate dehydrogenase [quinone] large subunit [Flavobacteriaceae bacterium MAR_2009_75]|nr:thiosulfate dehydrogenase [quinone] large subunit [Flavobacteriaceae bacterium MAR_2009_75]
MKRNTLHYFLRLPLAVSMFGHGVVRLPKLQIFSSWMMETMAESLIPQFLILPFSYALPIVELLIGLFMLIGFYIRYAVIAGIIVMSLLILGSCSIENWGAVGTQLLHAIYFAILLFLNERK